MQEMPALDTNVRTAVAHRYTCPGIAITARSKYQNRLYALLLPGAQQRSMQRAVCIWHTRVNCDLCQVYITGEELERRAIP
jgi:hypothetical protein